MTTPRQPAEVFPVGHFIEEEMRERGWTREELAKRFDGPLDVNLLALEIALDCPNKGLVLGDMSDDLAKAFGTSAEFWKNLDDAWQRAQ